MGGRIIGRSRYLSSHSQAKKETRGIVQYTWTNPLQLLHDGLGVLVSLGLAAKVTGKGL